MQKIWIEMQDPERKDEYAGAGIDRHETNMTGMKRT